MNDGTGSAASISLALSGGPASATLTGTNPRSGVAGVRGFDDLHVRKAGTGYSLTASSTGLTPATSSSFNVTHGAPTKLVFTNQPNASYTAADTISVTVQVQDAWDNVVNDGTGSGSTINLALSGGNPAATLGSTSGNSTSKAASAGTATFNGLTVNRIGTAYKLNASNSGLTGAASSAFNITAAQTTTALTLGSGGSIQYSDPIALTATVTPVTLASGENISGTVNFYSNYGLGSQTLLNASPAAVNASGVATASPAITLAAGSYPITAVFTSTNAQFASGQSTAQTLTVTKEDATLVYSGDSIGVINVNLTLKATVTESLDGALGDITKMSVAFDIYSATACGTGTPTTVTAAVVDTGTVGDGIGSATATYTSSSEATYCVFARLVTNNYYTTSNDATAAITFYKNLGQFVTGGGWVTDSNSSNGKGNFGFNARYNNNGKAQGQMVYVWRGTYGGVAADYVIKSNSLTALSFTGTTYPLSATLQGGATLQILRASDGYLLASQGGGTFVATAKDTDGSGADTFALTYNGSTLNKSFDALNLQGGNIVIHLK